MNKLLPLLLAIGTSALLPSGASGADGGKGYEAYKLVRTRNIFDPNRKVIREAPPRSTTPSRPRSSSFTLTGTMVRDGRSLAFFSGSRSEFSKVISVGDGIANYKVTAIEPAQVELDHDGKKVTLVIGRPFQIEGLPGEPDSPDDAAAKPDAAETPGNPSPPPGAAPAPTNDKSEILRRMMERRAEELKK